MTVVTDKSNGSVHADLISPIACSAAAPAASPVGRHRAPRRLRWAGGTGPERAAFGRWPSAAVAVVLLAVVLAACGNNAKPEAQPSTTTTTSTSTTVAATSTTASPSAAVLSAYRAGWAAFEHASATSNAFDPQLPATMVDPLLQQVRRNLVGDQGAGIVARGTFTLHPRLKSITGSTAVVVDCAYSTSE
ncbi:MAG: hypothetical protein ACRDNS_30885, partial [Trebonia sp.]